MKFNKKLLFSHPYLSKFFSKLSFTPKLVDIDKIRCQRNKKFSDFCGFGGKHIKYFPPYNFFKEYLEQPKKGKDQFVRWYYKIFVIYGGWKVPKMNGGFLNGSLYKTVKLTFDKSRLNINRKTLIENKNLVENVIKKRIEHYFEIFDSIIQLFLNNHHQVVTNLL